MPPQGPARADADRRLEHLEALFELRDRLQGSASYDDMYESAFDAMDRVLGVGRASIQLFDRGGATRFIARRGLSERYVRLVEERWRSTFDASEPQTFVSADIEADAERESLWAEIVSEGIRSLVSIPLVAQRRLLGKFVVYHGERRQFTKEEIDLARTIANNVAFAIDRKQSEDALRESAQSLRLALGASKTGTWRWSAASGAIAWDEFTHEIFGIEPGAFGGTFADLFALIHPDDRDRVQRETNESVERRRDHDTTFRVIRPDGAVRHVASKGKCLFDAEGGLESMTGVCQDVTDRQLAQEERERLLTQMQQAQKLESLGVLAGGVAHDFNNLLVGVIGNIEVVRRALPPGSAAAHALGVIETSAERAAALARQMLAYAGRGRFNVQELDLSELVTEMAELLRAVVSKRAQFRFDLAGGPAVVKADAAQLRQVVMNLITNAADAVADRDGHIWLRTGVMELDAAQIAALPPPRDIPPGRYAYVEIEDDGCGMDEATQARIFDPFFTTKFAGRGLGLAAALGIVRGHRGAIRLSSTPGVGTTFRVLLPGTERSATATATTAAAAAWIPQAGADAAAWRGSGAVLVVDDEPLVRGVVKGLVESLGFDVVAAGDGPEALRLFAEAGDRIVAVVLDMTMPGMSGLEVLAKLRAARPGVPVILCSGFSEHRAGPGREEGGPDAFVEKPFRRADLVAAFRSLLPARGAAPRPPTGVA